MSLTVATLEAVGIIKNDIANKGMSSVYLGASKDQDLNDALPDLWLALSNKASPSIDGEMWCNIAALAKGYFCDGEPIAGLIDVVEQYSRILASLFN
jgi:hypothetical protein